MKGEEKDEGDNRRQIFEEKMLLGLDNHFSGDCINQFIGSNGYKSVLTVARDRLPTGQKKYLHHIKQVTVDHRSRMARFEHPIVAVQKVDNPPNDGKPYCVVHTSFQSTGSTNIATVNALPRGKNFISLSSSDYH